MIKFLYKGKEYEAPSEEMIPDVLGITVENAFDALYEEVQITFKEESKGENNNNNIQSQEEQKKMTKEDFLKMLEKKTQEKEQEVLNPYKNNIFEKQTVDPSKLEGLNFVSSQTKVTSQPMNPIKETISPNFQTPPQQANVLNDYYKFLNEKEGVNEETYEKIEKEESPKEESIFQENKVETSTNPLLTEFFIDLYNNILIKIKNRDLQDKMFSVLLDTIEQNDLYIDAVENNEELSSAIYSIAEELNVGETEEEEELDDNEEEEEEFDDYEEEEEEFDDYEEEEELDDYEEEEEE